MAESACPFCKEAIKSDAALCKHCRSWLGSSREGMLMSALSAPSDAASNVQLAGARPGILASMPSVTDCNAWCIWKHRGDKVGLRKCLDDCKAQSAIKALAEKLHFDLQMTFFEIIWKGGNIDPKPLEKAVREQFAKSR